MRNCEGRGRYVVCGRGLLRPCATALEGRPTCGSSDDPGEALGMFGVVLEFGLRGFCMTPRGTRFWTRSEPKVGSGCDGCEGATSSGAAPLCRCPGPDWSSVRRGRCSDGASPERRYGMTAAKRRCRIRLHYVSPVGLRRNPASRVRKWRPGARSWPAGPLRKRSRTGSSNIQLRRCPSSM